MLAYAWCLQLSIFFNSRMRVGHATDEYLTRRRQSAVLRTRDLVLFVVCLGVFFSQWPNVSSALLFCLVAWWNINSPPPKKVLVHHAPTAHLILSRLSGLIDLKNKRLVINFLRAPYCCGTQASRGWDDGGGEGIRTWASRVTSITGGWCLNGNDQRVSNSKVQRWNFD